MLGQRESPPSCMESQKEVQCQGLPSPHSVLPAPVCESGHGSSPLLGGIDPKLLPLQPSLAVPGKGILKFGTSDPTASSPVQALVASRLLRCQAHCKGSRPTSCSWHDLFPAAWPQTFTNLPGPQFPHLQRSSMQLAQGFPG